MKKHDELAVVVVSCDAYSDVAAHFFPLFKKHWAVCSYPIHFINSRT